MTSIYIHVVKCSISVQKEFIGFAEFIDRSKVEKLESFTYSLCIGNWQKSWFGFL